jgi:hypothetical protein
MSATQSFIDGFKVCAEAAHDNAIEKGFYKTLSSFGDRIALTHANLSKALEVYREGNPPDPEVPGFSSAEVRMADAIISMLDASHHYGWNLGGALIARMEFDRTQPRLHGGKPS